MRNLLIARVCGADSDLIAATADQRPAQRSSGGATSPKKDLTRFFQILLETDGDLRHKPGILACIWRWACSRLINAQRLAPMEELLAELRSGTSSGTAAGAAGDQAR